MQHETPRTSVETMPYWDAARQGHLVMRHCPKCDRWLSLTTTACTLCGGVAEWRRCSGRGSVYTYTAVHRAPREALQADAPYVLAIVELEEGPRIMSDIIGCPPSSVVCGMHVHLSFEPTEEANIHVPVFVPDRRL